MTPAEYRTKALWHAEKAVQETDPARRAEYLKLALSYNFLADLAEKNAATDVVYEPPPPRPPDQPVQQQQQQIQPKPEEKE